MPFSGPFSGSEQSQVGKLNQRKHTNTAKEIVSDKKGDNAKRENQIVHRQMKLQESIAKRLNSWK